MTQEELIAKISFDSHRKVRFSLDGSPIRIRSVSLDPDNSVHIKFVRPKKRPAVKVPSTSKIKPEIIATPVP